MRYLRKIIKYLSFGALVAGALVMVLPFIWTLISSFKPAAEIYAVVPSFLPKNATLENYRQLFALHNALPYILNSLIVTGAITIGVIIISPATGYVFGRFRFPGRDLLFALMLGTMMVPLEVFIIPLYVQASRWGWIDTRIGLIVPFLFDPFAVFLCRQYVVSIPQEYIESARIDGLSEWGIFAKIIVPLIKPVLSALIIFCFIWSWDSLLWPLILINTTELKTVPLLAISFQAQYRILYDMVITVSSLTVWPALVVFLVFRKNFTEGVVLSGLKG